MSQAAVRAKRDERRRERRGERVASKLDSQARAGQIWAGAAQMAKKLAVPGATTAEIDKKIESFVRTEGGKPTNKGYQGSSAWGQEPPPYPAATCFMPNDMVAHGIPNSRPLLDGDILTFDMGVTVGGMHADAAITFPIGKVSEEAERLMLVCYQALWKGIAQCRPGLEVGDISLAIEKAIEPSGFGIVHALCGHGINSVYHDAPQVTNFYDGQGSKLYDGQVLALEPIITAGTGEIRHGDDGWTIWTTDGSLAAQFEHTVVVGKTPRILTRLS